MTAPSIDRISERALVLYALIRRAAIEVALDGFEGDPARIDQAEAAREETDRWLGRESLTQALTPTESSLLSAPSHSWPREAVVDMLWRKEALGVLLWFLGHVDSMPPFGDEFDVIALNRRIEAYGSVQSFRVAGQPRRQEELVAALDEANAWLAATEGRSGPDATLASASAERARALTWLTDDDAAPA